MSGMAIAPSGRRFGLLAASLAIAVAAPLAGAVAGHIDTSTVADGLSIQFTDKFLDRPDWRERLDLLAATGAKVVRIDLNWDWIEKTRGLYDWGTYDAFVEETKARGLRPLFIVNRTNRLWGEPFRATVDGRLEEGASPPRRADDVAAYARWAAAAAERFRPHDPIWELWNEPDQAGSWPPAPDPAAYVALARAGCRAIKGRVPEATVVGPAAAQIPTRWHSSKPLFAALMADHDLLDCLDAVSLHTHRFGQQPETLGRDFAVLRANYLAAWPTTVPRKPVIDTEWGDSVYASGIGEDQQARWLPRMFLAGLMEQIGLTNWYCLQDVGNDDKEMEHRFGLVRWDGSRRPAYRAYEELARQIGSMTLRDVVTRYDVRRAEGATVLRFCDTSRCTLAAWSTDGYSGSRTVTVPGFRRAGPIVGHLGQEITPIDDGVGELRVEVTPDVRYVPVAPIEPATPRP